MFFKKIYVLYIILTFWNDSELIKLVTYKNLVH